MLFFLRFLFLGFRTSVWNNGTHTEERIRKRKRRLIRQKRCTKQRTVDTTGLRKLKFGMYVKFFGECSGALSEEEFQRERGKASRCIKPKVTNVPSTITYKTRVNRHVLGTHAPS